MVGTQVPVLQCCRRQCSCTGTGVIPGRLHWKESGHRCKLCSCLTWEAVQFAGIGGCGQEVYQCEMLLTHLGDCHSIAFPACALLCLGMHSCSAAWRAGSRPQSQTTTWKRHSPLVAWCSASTGAREYQSPARLGKHHQCNTIKQGCGTDTAELFPCLRRDIWSPIFVVYSIKAGAFVIKVTEHITKLNMSYEMFWNIWNLRKLHVLI